jgi:hypothetical protein
VKRIANLHPIVSFAPLLKASNYECQ